MTRKPSNPFGPPEKMAADLPKTEHASDAPGYKIEKRTRSSGAHSPSEPRRPGSGARQAPRRESMERLEESDPLVPGEVLYGEGDVEINAGQPITTIRVINAADRPVQVGSHYHFAEANEALEFDREAAWGKRLNVLSGGAVRFEPGAVEEVELIPIRGRRIVPGLRGLCRGGLDG